MSGDQRCPNMKRCPMFPLFRLEATLSVWRSNYCESRDYARCERWRHFQRGEKPADGMLPNGKLLPAVLLKKRST